MSKSLVAVEHTHFNKGIEDQLLLLRLAIGGGGCHVVGACHHCLFIFFIFWRALELFSPMM
jgi:hypothetical protein